MLRHGISVANERRIYSGTMDVPLSAKGEQDLLARRARVPQASAFFTSGMRRARQTLRLLYGDVDALSIPALAERNCGIFEGHSHDDLCAHEPRYRAWLEGDADGAPCPGGESRAVFTARILSGWEELLRHDWQGLAVLVTHGGVMSMLLPLITGEPGPFSTPHNGEGWRLALAAGGDVRSFEAFA